MPRIIKEYKDGTIIDFDQGRIDDWGVHLTCYNVSRYRPKDVEYFSELVSLARNYGANYVYNDFITIYELCTNHLDSSVLRVIDDISDKYGIDKIKVDKLFTILYATMIAEENRKHTRLGKRIKRLGIHQILVDGYSIYKAANYSKGKKWKEIDAECSRRGF